MFKQNIYLALDISALSVKVIQFKISKNNPDIISYGAKELPAGFIEDGEIKKPNELSIAIKDLFNNVKGERIKSLYVGCSLPEEKSFVRLVSLPSMSDKELKEAVKWAAETEIPLKLDELYLGWNVIEKHFDQPESEHIDILLTASPKYIVDSYIDFLKNLGLVPVLVEVESSLVTKSLVKTTKVIEKKSLSFLSRFTRSGKTKKQNEIKNIPVGHNTLENESILIVDIGAHRTIFIIFTGKTLYFTSTTEIASNTLTNALAQQYKVEHIEAEKIKKTYGLDKEEQQGKLFGILAPSLDNLTVEINKVIDYYKEHNANHSGSSNISKVIICGGGALLKGITSHLQSALNLNVELGNPWVNFSNIDLSKKNKLPLIPKEISLSYTTSIGLALSIKEEHSNALKIL